MSRKNRRYKRNHGRYSSGKGCDNCSQNNHGDQRDRSDYNNHNCGNSTPKQGCNDRNTVVVPIPVPILVPVQSPVPVMQESVMQEPVVQITKHITTEIHIQPRKRVIRGVIIYRPSVGARILLRRSRPNQSEGTETMRQKAETTPCEHQRPQQSDSQHPQQSDNQRPQQSDNQRPQQSDNQRPQQRPDSREQHSQESARPKQDSKQNWEERLVLEALAKIYAQQYRAQGSHGAKVKSDQKHGQGQCKS
jgi:hypothetical protein